FMTLIASCVQRKAPVRFASTIDFHCSKVRSSSGTLGAPEPALLKRRSNRPKTSTVWAKRALTELGSPTSVGTLSILAPSFDPSTADLVIADKRHAHRLPREVLEQMTRCLLIQMPAVGYDVIDHVAAAGFGIAVANAAGYNRDAVADWTVMAILNLLRRGSWGDR